MEIVRWLGFEMGGDLEMGGDREVVGVSDGWRS